MEFHAALGVALLLTLTVTLSVSPASAQKSPPAPIALPPTLPPSPAPVPAPQLLNLTYLLTVAGPFSTFLGYLEQTDVIETFQNQINSSYGDHGGDGITIFVPTNVAFAELKRSTFDNLKSGELKTLCLYHALSKYYSLAEFQKLSSQNPVSTLAGGQYAVNLTYVMGNISVTSRWSKPKITSSVFSTSPVAVYELDRVLLPLQIFTTEPPLAPAPAPGPAPGSKPADIAPTAGEKSKSGASGGDAALASSSSFRASASVLNRVAVAASAAWLVVLSC